MAAAPRATAILALWSGARLLSLARVGGAGADNRLLVFLDIGQAIDHPAAHLEELWPLTGPTPPLKCAMADPPAHRQFKLVHACCLHFRVFSSWQVGMRHDEGVAGTHYHGNTGRSAKHRARHCLVLNRELLRRRRFTHGYERVLALCRAYFERVCRRVLSLRQLTCTNRSHGRPRGHFSFGVKGLCGTRVYRGDRPDWRGGPISPSPSLSDLTGARLVKRHERASFQWVLEGIRLYGCNRLICSPGAAIRAQLDTSKNPVVGERGW